MLNLVYHNSISWLHYKLVNLVNFENEISESKYPFLYINTFCIKKLLHCSKLQEIPQKSNESITLCFSLMCHLFSFNCSMFNRTIESRKIIPKH